MKVFVGVAVTLGVIAGAVFLIASQAPVYEKGTKYGKAVR